jgi:hypothetical protein
METTRIDGEAGNGKAGTRSTATDAEDAAFDIVALVEEHPVATLATALGLGYALGGGVFTRLTFRAVALSLRLGFQLAVVPALERELANLAGGASSSLKGANGAKDAGGRAQH